ncbi:hypothetical protein D037_2715B, partial [Vibrio parahaemolyticus IDH02640]
LFDVIWGI